MESTSLLIIGLVLELIGVFLIFYDIAHGYKSHWKKEYAKWQPVWTTLPEASQSCYELWLHRGITRKCKLVKAALKCTALCTCNWDCWDSFATLFHRLDIFDVSNYMFRSL